MRKAIRGIARRFKEQRIEPTHPSQEPVQAESLRSNNNTSPNLCRRCERITANASLETFSAVQVELDFSTSIEEKDEQERTWSLGSYNSLLQRAFPDGNVSRNCGCQLCQLVAEAISFFYQDDQHNRRRAVLDDPKPSTPMPNDKDFEIVVSKTKRFSVYQLALHFHELKQRTKSGGFPNPDIYLAVIGEEEITGPHNTFMARDTKSTVDKKLISHWMNVCEDTHQQCRDVRCKQSGNSSGSRPSKMLIVDVHKLCVNVAPPDCRYATLSYVNGQAGLDTTNLYAQISAGVLPYSLGPFWELLPRTIKDAFILVREMGLSFVWIDALCISQNHPEERLNQINAMATIYQSASVNIISADGEDVASGIAGVPSNPRNCESRHIRDIKPGFRLKIAPKGILDHESDLVNKIYSTRGWTFQERLLAPRNLIFINDTVLFECQQAKFCEGYHWEDHDVVNSREIEWFTTNRYPTLPPQIFNRTPIFSQYLEIAREYTLRDLRFSKDIIPAFTGLMTVLSRNMQTDFHWCLPIAIFDLALLWRPVLTLVRRPGYPSWSWTGWIGGIDWPVIPEAFKRNVRTRNRFLEKESIISWLDQCTWICWWHFDASSDTFNQLPTRGSYKQDMDGSPCYFSEELCFGYLDSWASRCNPIAGVEDEIQYPNTWEQIHDDPPTMRGKSRLSWKAASKLSKPSKLPPRLNFFDRTSSKQDEIQSMLEQTEHVERFLQQAKDLTAKIRSAQESRVKPQIQDFEHSRFQAEIQSTCEQTEHVDKLLQQAKDCTAKIRSVQESKFKPLIQDFEHSRFQAERISRLEKSTADAPAGRDCTLNESYVDIENKRLTTSINPESLSMSQYLHFYTIVGKFALDCPFEKPPITLPYDEMPRSETLSGFCLSDSGGMLCGTIVLDRDEWTPRVGEIFDFLVLSLAVGWEWGELGAYSGFIKNAVDKAGFSQGSEDYDDAVNEAYEKAKKMGPTGSGPPPFFVMMVHWRDEGYAERIAIGKIVNCALQRSFGNGAGWREIVLG